jgi:hypothetical protein
MALALEEGENGRFAVNVRRCARYVHRGEFNVACAGFCESDLGPDRPIVHRRSKQKVWENSVEISF